MILPDYLKRGLEAVFCGTAVGNASAEVGHYYADPGNSFWPTLHNVGLTPELLMPERDAEVVKHGFGLTDLVKLHSGNDRDLRPDMYDVDGFRKKILKYEPRFVAFVGKEAAAAYFGLSRTRKVDYGLHETIGSTQVVVLPSTSGIAKKHFKENKRYWHRLAVLIHS